MSKVYAEVPQESLDTVRERKNWEFQTRMPIMIIFLGLVIVMLIIAIVILGLKVNEKADTNVNLCTTEECVSSAASLIQSIDYTVNPCDDFYGFVCNGYIRNNPFRDEEVGNFEALDTKLTNQLKALLESQNSTVEIDAIAKLKKVYNTCLDIEHIAKNSLKSLGVLFDLLGGWPIAKGDIWSAPAGTTLEDLLAKLLLMGLPNNIFGIYVAPVIMTKENRSLILVHQSGRLKHQVKSFLPMAKYASQYRQRISYDQRNYIGEIVKQLGNRTDEFAISNEFSQMQDLDLKLFWNLLSDHSEEDPSKMFVKMTIRELQKLSGKGLNWLLLLRKVFKGISTIRENEEIIVTKVNYIKTIGVNLSKFTRRTVINYVLWNVVLYLEYELYSGLGSAMPPWEYESDEKKARWEICFSRMNDILLAAMVRLYVSNHVDEKTINSANALVATVKETYKQMIEASSWLDEDTKKTAVVKAEKIKDFIGYPTAILNDTVLNSYYENFSPTEDNFLNVINSLKNQVKQELMTYTKPADNETWPVSPLTAGAFYFRGSNTIWYPAAMLQAPFYSANQLKAQNFGVIGSVIGHEIGLAFAYENVDYDEQGNLNPWLSEKSRKKYNALSQCYIDQYSKFCNIDECVNGNQTRDENFADNTGLLSAYKSYQQWIKDNGNEARLPGLERFTGEQLFFISFAQKWCRNVSPILFCQSHSRARYRVEGSLSNSPYFAEAFGCSEGRMNRGQESCTFW